MTHSPHPVTGCSEISLPRPDPLLQQGPHPPTPGLLNLLSMYPAPSVFPFV